MCLYVLVSWAIHRCAVVGLFIYFTLAFSSRIIWFQLFYIYIGDHIYVPIVKSDLSLLPPPFISMWMTLHGHLCKASTKAPLSDPNPKLNTLQFYPTQLHIFPPDTTRFHPLLPLPPCLRRDTISPMLGSSVMCGIVTLMHMWDREVQRSPRICCCCPPRLPVSSSDVFGVPLKSLGRAWFGTRRRDFTISAKFGKARKHDYLRSADPDPSIKGGVLTHLSYFKPLKEKLK